MPATKSEIKKFERKVFGWAKKHGVEVKRVNGCVICDNKVTGLLEIYSKLAWEKRLNLAYEEGTKNIKELRRRNAKIRK